MNIQEILDAVESMSLLQVKELVDAMKEKFGVTGAIAVAAAPLPVVLLPLLKKKRPSSTSC